MKNLQFLVVMFLFLFVEISVAQVPGQSRRALDEFNVLMQAQQTPQAQFRGSGNAPIFFDLAKAYVMNFPHTSAQLRRIAERLPNDKLRLRLCKRAYPNVVDKVNFFDVYDGFQSLSFAMRLYHEVQMQDLSLGFQEPVIIPVVPNQINYPSYFNYNGPIGANCRLPMKDFVFANFQKNIKFKYQFSTPFQVLSAELPKNCFSTAQVMRLSLDISNLDNRAEYLRRAFALTYDMANFYAATQVLPAKAEKRKLRSFVDANMPAYYDYPGNGTPVLPPVAPCMVNNDEFDYLLRSIKDASFQSARLEVAKNIVSKKCLDMAQFTAIVDLFTFDDALYQLLTFSYQYVQDPSQMYRYADRLTFTNTKRKYNQFLMDRA